MKWEEINSINGVIIEKVFLNTGDLYRISNPQVTNFQFFPTAKGTNPAIEEVKEYLEFTKNYPFVKDGKPWAKTLLRKLEALNQITKE